MEVDSGRQKEFESKLAEAMQQLRQEHDGQIQQYKEDLEKNFNAKVHSLSLSLPLCLPVSSSFLNIYFPLAPPPLTGVN